VGAGVEAVVVDDLAGVEGVGQDTVEGLDRDRTLRQASRGRDGQPSAIQLGSQRLERVVAGGVGGEGPGDELGPVRVDGGDVGLAAVTGRGGVAVSQGRLADAVAVACLLAQAFLDLARQVVRVELRDAGHNAVQQHAAGGLVDVLRRGDQAGAELVEPLVEDDVVGAVAGQAVELVDDDVVDGLTAGDGLLQVAQHGLQGRAAGGGARGAALDELLDNGRADGLGLALVGRPLCRDGEALFVAAALGLLAGGHPQVGHGSLGGEFLGQERHGVLAGKWCCECVHVFIDALLVWDVQGSAWFPCRRSVGRFSRVLRIRGVGVGGMLCHESSFSAWSVVGGPSRMISGSCCWVVTANRRGFRPGWSAR